MLSPFERAIFLAGDNLAVPLLSIVDIHTVMQLAITGPYPRQLVSLYHERIFDIDNFFSLWLGRRTGEFLGFMDEEVALEGFQYWGWPFLPLETPAGRLRARLTQEALLHQRRSGERTFREVDHIGTGLLFHDPHRQVSIYVRLVDGEAYRHILSQHSTGINRSAALMCYITSKSAVALFPRSTFIHYRSYLTGRRTAHDPKELFEDLVSGPPVSETLWRDRELDTMPRRFGDRLCWSISRKGGDKTSNPMGDAPGSHKFEVRDWKEGVFIPGTYCRMSEPGVVMN
ncbi:hypothetical protein BKA70DRAFT_1240985 [Coprinopsis sp. MPI-PUGE-AT-0042]|nr:hypothetical protein BKA70DRAFT_1240985 [Coprinopsis sp. MPI-PUGE-AT-0042]